MKRAAIILCSAAAAIALWAGQAGTQPPAAAAAPKTADEAKAMFVTMAEMQSRPAPQHKVLESLAGKWNVKSRVDMAAVGMPMPAFSYDSNGDYKMILGGRFLACELRSVPGEKFQGESVSVYGFDTRTGKFTLWGIDTLGTYSISAQGDFDEATKTLTLLGENEEPGMGKVPFRWVLENVGADKHTGKIEFKFPGRDWGTMVSFEFERAK